MAMRKFRELKENGVRLLQYDFDAYILGKRRRDRVKVPTKEAAQALYKQWLAREATGGKEHWLFDKLSEYLKYAEQHKTPRAVIEEQRQLNLFRSFFKDMPLQSMKRHHVEDFIPWRRKHRLNGTSKVSDATINRDLATLHYFFNWCIEREYYSGMNPVHGTHLTEDNERVVSLTKEQVGEMFEKANDYQRHFLMIVLYTGMRRGEICGLKWSQVDLESGLIHLEAHETKGKKRRDITMPDALSYHLKAKRAQEPFEPYVITYHGKRIASLKKSWEALRRKLSFTAPDDSPLRFHDLRHVFATNLRKSGVELSEIKENMGHANVNTTQRYAHWDATANREQVNRLHAYMPEAATKMA